ncbi:MAG: hypothetical protein QNL62_17970 [Gammaproteobacteria bacterium]|nr:hypothetical protein [Gammaproteobacteria bacterium]
MALDASKMRQLQLVKIESVFQRIESGEYGYCLGCDKDIDIRRLMVDPISNHCIKFTEKMGN